MHEAFTDDFDFNLGGSMSGHGGARIGAGRPAKHITAESCRRLDIRDLARQGVLSEGGALWVWRDTRDCSIRIDGNVLVLRHSLALAPMAQRVPILRTACHFGGERPWFGCPGCGRRVAVLMLRPKGFACRHCAGAAYTSQREDDLGRALRARRRASARLGSGGIRPKGMRYAAYRALLSRIEDAEHRYCGALLGMHDALAH